MSSQVPSSRLSLTAICLLAVAFLTACTMQISPEAESASAAAVGDPVLGPADAPVEIVKYADFGCSYCRTWHNDGIRDQILDTYGDQVRIVWKDLPIVTAESPRAAEAGHCAAAQGKFWTFHDIVYEEFDGLGDSALQEYASQAGLDLEAFNSCLAQGTMASKVQANEENAERLGLRGTPSFVVDGEPMPSGPPTYEQLAARIDQALSAQ